MSSFFDSSGSLIFDPLSTKVFFCNVQNEYSDNDMDMNHGNLMNNNNNSLEPQAKHQESSHLISPLIAAAQAESPPTPTNKSPVNVQELMPAVAAATGGEANDSGTFSEIMENIITTSTVNVNSHQLASTNTAPSSPSPTKQLIINRMEDEHPEKLADSDTFHEQRTRGATLVNHGCDQYDIRNNNNIKPDSTRCSLADVTKSESHSCLNVLLSNFNQAFEAKIAEVERGRGKLSELEMLKEKILLYQDWVSNLAEQNSLLIGTVTEMEEETEQKIELLQRKMQKSTKLTESHMTMITEYERQVQVLLGQRVKDEANAESRRKEIKESEEQYKKLQEKFSVVEREAENLVTLLTRIRDSGVWDMSGLQLESRTYFRLFELYPRLPGSEVQTVFTREKAKKAKESEKHLEEMATKFQELLRFKEQFEEIIGEKDAQVKNLEDDKKKAKCQIQALEKQIEDTKSALEQTQALLVESNVRLNAVTVEETERTKMLNELSELKSALSVACNERRIALIGASQLKTEMSQRVNEIKHLKSLLCSIEAETESTKSQMKDLQDQQTQLTPLKEQVQLYQSKYKETKSLLNDKCDTIQKLLDEMGQLRAKVRKSEMVSHTPSSNCNPPKYFNKPPLNDSATFEYFEISDHDSNKPPWNDHFVKNNNKSRFLNKEMPSSTAEKDYRGRLFIEPMPMPITKSKLQQTHFEHKSDLRHATQQSNHYAGVPIKDEEFMRAHQKKNEQILNSRKCNNYAMSLNYARVDVLPPYDPIPPNLSKSEAINLRRLKNKCLAKYLANELTKDIKKGMLSKLPKAASSRSAGDIIGRSHQRSTTTDKRNRGKKLKKANQNDLQKSVHFEEKERTNENEGSNRRNCRTAVDYKEHRKKEAAADLREKIDALVSATVNASQQMIETFSPEDQVQMKVVATRHHRRQEQESRLRVRSRTTSSRPAQIEHSVYHSDQESESVGFGDQHEPSQTGIKVAQTQTTEEWFRLLKYGRNKKYRLHSPEKGELKAKAKKQNSTSNKPKSGVSRPTERSQEITNSISKNKKNENEVPTENLLAAVPRQRHKSFVQNWVMVNSQLCHGEGEGTESTHSGTTDSKHVHLSKSDSNNSHHFPTIRDKLSSLKKIRSEEQANLHKTDASQHDDDDDDDNVLEMEEQVKNLVSGEGEESDSTTQTSTNSYQSRPSGHNWSEQGANKEQVKSIQELRNQVSTLESQILSKDTLISSLYCEVEVEKLAKAGLSSSMESKDVEITMQKVQERKAEIIALRCEAICTAFRIELLEKNLLIYQSYNLLSRIERDYSNGDNNQTLYQLRGNEMADGREILSQQQLEELRAIRARNVTLRQRFEKELANICSLEEELKANANTAPPLARSTPSSSANNILQEIAKLEEVNASLKREHETLMKRDRKSSVATAAQSNMEMERSAPPVADSRIENIMTKIETLVKEAEKTDEVIAMRNKQILEYENYIRLLINKLQEWMETYRNKNYKKQLESQQVLELRETADFLKHEAEQEALRNEKYTSQVQKLKTELMEMKAREEKAKNENEQLWQSLYAASNKMNHFVNSFESLETQWQDVVSPVEQELQEPHNLMSFASVGSNTDFTDYTTESYYSASPEALAQVPCPQGELGDYEHQVCNYGSRTSDDNNNTRTGGGNSVLNEQGSSLARIQELLNRMQSSFP